MTEERADQNVMSRVTFMVRLRGNDDEGEKPCGGVRESGNEEDQVRAVDVVGQRLGVNWRCIGAGSESEEGIDA